MITTPNPTPHTLLKRVLTGLLAVLLVTVNSAVSPPSSAADAPTDTAPTIQINASNKDAPLPKGVDPASGFRMSRYRAPVPDTNPGTEVVTTERAFELYTDGQVKFIDVYPPKGLGANPLDGTWMTNEKHQSIPGAVWLPEVGRGHIEQEHIAYFQRNLTLITNDNKQTPLMFYCTADCWQSWNAARRAMLWGYSHIFWYPAGTDGWRENNHPLEPITPVNFLGE